MKIGVIGTGNIGGTLARKLSAAGHDVRVTNSRGLEGVRAFADEIGATAVDTRGLSPKPSTSDWCVIRPKSSVPAEVRCPDAIGRGDYRQNPVNGTHPEK